VTPVSVTPVSVTPVSVTPVSVTPVSVTPVSVTPVSAVSLSAPQAPAAQPPAAPSGGLDLLPDDEPEEQEPEEDFDDDEDDEPEEPVRRGSSRVGRASSGRNKSLRRTSSRRAQTLPDDEFDDEPRAGAGLDPKVMAAIGAVAGVLLLIGGFLVLRSDDKPKKRKRPVRQSSPTPSRTKKPRTTPTRRAPPKRSLANGRAAFATLTRGFGRDGLKDVELIQTALTKRGRARLLALTFDRAKHADAKRHAATCKELGLPSDLPTDEAALVELLGGKNWSRYYSDLVEIPTSLRLRNLTKFRGQGKGGTAMLRLAADRIQFEVRVEFSQEQDGWHVDFPDDLYPGLAALQNLVQAMSLLKDGDAAQAFELLRDAPKGHAKAQRVRLNALQKLAQAAVDLARKAMEEDPLAAAKDLEVFQAKYRDDLAGTGLDESVAKVLLSLKGPDAAPEEPPDRIAASIQAAAKGRERAEELRAQIRREKKVRDGAIGAELERARTASAKSPLNLNLAKGFALTGAVLESRNDRGFRVTATEGAAARPWSTVPPAVALKLRMLGVRPDDAQDQLRLGFWALRQRNFKQARKAFNAAIKLDGSLASKTPNVSNLEEAARVFRGKFTRKGMSVTIDYPFKKEAEGKDWAFTPFSKTSAKVQDGALVATGRGIFLVGTQEIGFDGRCDLSATIEKVSGDHGGCFGIGFDTDSENALWYLVSVYPKHRFMRLYRYRNGNLETLKEKRKAVRPTGSTQVGIVIRGNSLRVVSSGQTRMAVKIPTPSWNGTRVFVGGAGPGRPAEIRLSKVRLKGHVRFAWLRKSFARLDALLFKALSRSGELPVFTTGGTQRPIDTALSAEDEFGLSKATPKALKAYRKAVGQLGSEDWRQLYQVAKNIGTAIHLSPEFAAAYYVRARLFHKIGSAFLAERDLEIACRLSPRFYEAQAFRARVLLDIGRPDEALAQAQAAIKSSPGSADGYVARGLVLFSQDKLKVALEDLELARALAPWQEELIGFSRNVQNVINGPPWARRFETTSENYVVQTNVSATAAKEYADLLEAGRAHYAKTFPLPENGPKRVSKVLIFDTQEGYHGYSELSINDRVESTLGCYLPRYRQLLLFEEKVDKSRRKTVQVLLHEGFHQFMHQLVPDNAIPFWLNEGLAEYMSAVEIQGGRVGRTGLILKGRLDNLLYFVKSNGGRPMPFQKLMQETPQEFYSGAVWAKYAQAWSMVHFFELAATVGTKSRYKRYLAALRAGTPSKEAFKQFWQGADWSGMQKRWWTHVQGMKTK
ncbi:MAG: DUF1570 domain-containing protein, partial [Planctomycetes bacterium]|nr:DUF1570 domain-containing protein [Planctomycetota bacterium]